MPHILRENSHQTRIMPAVRQESPLRQDGAAMPRVSRRVPPAVPGPGAGALRALRSDADLARTPGGAVG